MPVTIQNDTALHEAAHTILAYLNSDIFNIEMVTINEKISRYEDSRSLGGLKGRLIKEPQNLNFQDHDRMTLMLLAGMAADDINHNDKELSETLYKNEIWSEKMNSNKYSLDATLASAHITRLEPQLRISQREYTLSCQKLLHEILLKEWIFNLLIGLKTKLESASDNTLTKTEINKFLNNTALKSFKENEWKGIIKNRFENFSTDFKKPIPHIETLEKKKKVWLVRVLKRLKDIL